MLIFRVVVGFLVIPSLALTFATHAGGKHHNRVQNEAIMSNHATGTFEVKLTPQDDKSDDKTLGRMTIEKQWRGDLEGNSKGQMLTAGSGDKSGAYVAIEKFTGTLGGKTGTFVFRHRST